jgi:hypothetical protein
MGDVKNEYKILVDNLKALKEDERDRGCSTNGREEECIHDIGGKARRKETTEKTRHRWVDNTKMDLIEMGWEDMY